jgi:hypothetical protein
MKLSRLAGRAAVILACFAIAACHPRSSTPPDIANLEREVSLQLAHVRDIGPTEQEKRRKMSDAAGLEHEAEKAIAAGDWRTAEDKLLRARDLLQQIAQ